MRHGALSLFSSSSLRTGSAVPHKPFRCLFFSLLVQTADSSSWFSPLESKTFHRINTISLEFVWRDVSVLFPVFRIRILRKIRANNTVTFEKMEGHQIRSSLNVTAFKTLPLNRTKALLCLLITPSVLEKLWEVLSRKWHKLTQNAYETQHGEVTCVFFFSPQSFWLCLVRHPSLKIL